ncbi:MAG: tRNA (adenosine(37)-N6)-threonylcarbamoyltransferase complex ATPase subunit type 1 TsaE [Magnetovibrio sp.]|nr:tRNA (adenosine(37)-N6)-threonylcarbamoyltransferase complex ATPase subunit type 1 TsaE [Magnetovibrio sp.]
MPTSSWIDNIHRSHTVIADDNSLDLALVDETETEALAVRLSAAVGPGDVIALFGNLGMGKSVFARAFIRAYAGIDEEIPSPTFTLVQVYEADAAPIFHFDLYRLEAPEEALELGIEEAFVEGISLIEWPDRLGPWMPVNRLEIYLTTGGRESARRARLIGYGYWQARLIDGIGDGAMHG